MRYGFYALALCTVILSAGLFFQPAPTNPGVAPGRGIEASVNVPDGVRNILRRSCYDCHSSETRWPWYAAMPGLSRRLEADVLQGRSTMNFSDWTGTAGRSPARAASTLSAVCVAVRQGIMPKSPYTYLHPGAKLSPEEINQLCEWTQEQSQAIRAARRANSH
jgi:hypothetical protein